MRCSPALRKLLRLVLAVLACLPQAAAAQRAGPTAFVATLSTSSVPAAEAARTVTAIRAPRAPALDGRDDDAIWRNAPRYAGLRQFSPREDAAPTFPTEFRVAYDDAALYVFVRAYDPHSDSSVHALARRDQAVPTDEISVLIDSYNDGRTGYEFAVSLDGVRSDVLWYADTRSDTAWDAVWQVSTHRESDGWTAEFRIPFSQLRFPSAPSHTFGFAVKRVVARLNESDAWPTFRPSRNGVVSQFGRLTGITGIAAARLVELTPYALAKNAQRARAHGYGRAQEQTVGGDLRYGLSSNLTLDATVFPDFGQVEADPSVLNLSTTETFLPDKRPFFLAGKGLYRFDLNCTQVYCQNEALFHSRRIGRTPQLLGLYGDAGSPATTPIAAAAKLTGRSAGGLSLGLLDAVTERVAGGAPTLEPRTNYAVARVQQDLAGGRGGVGLMATAVERALDGWSVDSLRRNAYAAAVDFRLRFGGSQYELAGSVVASRVGGSRAALAATQRDAVHAYQRPDAGLPFDSTRTSLLGDAESLTLGKYGGGITRFETSYNRQSPGFEVNDIGYLQRADVQSWTSFGALVFNEPTRLYQRLELGLNNYNAWTAAGLHLQTFLDGSGHLVLRSSNWRLNAGVALYGLGGTFCDRCTRGGPARRVSPGFEQCGSVSGDTRRALVPSVMIDHYTGAEGRSHWLSVTPSLVLRVATGIQGSLGAAFTENRDDAQWYGAFTDAGGATHYSFAHLDQRTVGLTGRLSYTPAPDLTLELYAAPFVSSGRYSRIRELSRTPGAWSYDARFAPFVAPASSPDGFEFSQLRANTVLRWEYRPGSTLFLVWTHGRDGSADAASDRSWLDGYRGLFQLHPENTFLLKAAYRIGR